MSYSQDLDCFESVEAVLDRPDNVGELSLVSRFEFPLKRNNADVHSLFDMDQLTVDDERPPRVTKRTVKQTRFALSADGTVVIEEDSYLSLREQKQMDYDVNFNIIKPCQGGGRMPSMPSLRLEMNERDYHEPIRDRDKNWFLASQRGVIEKKGLEFVSPKFDLDLGAYENINAKSPLFWSSGFQAMIREKIMMRKAAIISDTNCLVTVYGLGIDGRVVANGGSGSKLVIIEAYSIWNSTKYFQFLNSMRLRILLNKTPDLLKPGKKKELLSMLIQLLYFKYTITIPSAHHGVHSDEEHHHPEHSEAFDHHHQTSPPNESNNGTENPSEELLQGGNEEVDPFSETVELANSNDPLHEENDTLASEGSNQHSSEMDTKLSTVESTEALIQNRTEDEAVEAPEAAVVTEDPVSSESLLQSPSTPIVDEEVEAGEEEAERKSVTESVKGSVHSKHSKTPSHRSTHSNQPHIQHITHLDLPVMPEGYPKTIEEMIRIPPVPPESKEMPAPIIAQELCISDTTRENGPKLRKRLVEINRRITAAREAEELRIWLATPKIRRNLMFIRGMKINQKLFIVRCYFSEIRPTVLTVKAMASVECITLSTFLGLNKIKGMLQLTSKIAQWTKDDIKLHAKHVLPQLQLDRPTREFDPRNAGKHPHENDVNLSLGGDCGPEVVLEDFRTMGQLMQIFTRRRKAPISGRVYDPFTLEWTSSQPSDRSDPDCAVAVRSNNRQEVDEWEGLRLPPESREELSSVELSLVMIDQLLDEVEIIIEQTTDASGKVEAAVNFDAVDADTKSQKVAPLPAGAAVTISTTISTTQSVSMKGEMIKPSTASNAIDLPAKCDTLVVSQSQPGWTSLGRAGSSRSFNPYVFGVLKPLRCVKAGMRLTSHAVKVGGVYVIYTLHMTNSPYRGQGIPWPERPPPPPPTPSASMDDKPSDEVEEEGVNVVVTNSASIDETSLANESVEEAEEEGGDVSPEAVSRPTTAASEVSEKSMGKHSVHTDTTGSDDEDDDSEEEEEEELDYEDQISEVYDSYCPGGLKLELDIYIPQTSVYQGVVLEAHTTHRMILSKADLYQYVEDRELLSWALLALYKDFYTSASAEAVARAEEAWVSIGREIVDKAYWSVRESGGGGGAGRSTLLPPSSAQMLQEVLCRDFTIVPPVINTFRPFRLPHRSSSDDEVEEQEEHHRTAVVEAPVGEVVFLTLSNVSLNKYMFVTSAAETRDKRVMLQVYFWQKDEACGVACIDKERQCVYLTQPAGEELQSAQLRTFRMMEPFERAANIQTYLMSELQYNEDDNGIGKVALVESTLEMDV